MIEPMVQAARTTGIAAGLLLLASATVMSQSSQGRSGSSDMAVMSDTAAWCAHFAAHVAMVRQKLPGPHPKADKLAGDGRRLCAAGHVRLGINRLRYALIELRDR